MVIIALLVGLPLPALARAREESREKVPGTFSQPWNLFPVDGVQVTDKELTSMEVVE